jgi:hypothetical protein
MVNISSDVQTNLNNKLDLSGGTLSGNLICNALLQRLPGGNIFINLMNTTTGYVQYMTDSLNSASTMVLDVQTSAVVSGVAPNITNYTIHPPVNILSSINGITPTQLTYLTTLSSNVQTQLNLINASYLSIFGGTLLDSLMIQKSNNIGYILNNNSNSCYLALAYTNGSYNNGAVSNDLILRNDNGRIILSSSSTYKDFMIDKTHNCSTYGNMTIGGNLILGGLSGFLSTGSYPPTYNGVTGLLDAGTIINSGLLFNSSDINIGGFSAGLNYELPDYYGCSPFNPAILNLQYNYRNNNGSTTNIAQPGACFRIDSRTPSINLYQWINRDAGSAVETIVATLDSTGLFKTAGLFTTGGTANFGFISSGSNLYVASLIAGVGYFNMFSGAYTATSDERLKENINIIDEMSSIDIIKLLQPKYYNYKSDGEKKQCIGFIAQDVLKVSPNSVESHDNKYAQIQNMLTLNKDDLFVHNVNATKNIISHLEVVDKSTIELYTRIENQEQNIKILHGDLMYANQQILNLTNTINDLTSQINIIKNILLKNNIV